MVEKAQATDVTAPGAETAPAAPPPPRRGPGHRGADVRDTMAEMAARAHEISLEAGSKMAGALRDVVSAAAGMADFALDSAKDLVHYMVRRGQMTQDDAERLLKEAEEAAAKRPAPKVAPPAPAAAPDAKAAPRAV